MSLFENPDQLRQLQELLNPNRNRRGGGHVDSSSDSEDDGQSLVVTKPGKRMGE